MCRDSVSRNKQICATCDPVVGVEPVSSREVVQVSVDILKVPRIGRRIERQPDLSFRRHMTDVVAHSLGQRREPLLVQQLESVDQQVVVLTGGDTRSQPFPSATPGAAIDRRPKQTNDDAASAHIKQYKVYPIR